jgi:hypothetical protein
MTFRIEDFGFRIPGMQSVLITGCIFLLYGLSLKQSQMIQNFKSQIRNSIGLFTNS